MQSVSAAFTAEERSTFREIAHNLQVSWKKFSTLGGVTFTIGVSTIGGKDVIGANPGVIGSPLNYRYFDDSDYVMALAWEREYNMPTGGLIKALAEADLDNTSGRFTPRFMGGSSELFTAVYKPRRPFIISAGFKVSGVDLTVPQFSGITTNPTRLDARARTVKIQGADWTDFFQNRSLVQSAMFTGYYTDQWMSYLLRSELGMTTAQFDLDTGINLIPFGYFPSGAKFADVFGQLAEAENGHFYQDESGIFKFENRQHWYNSPYTDVQRILSTGQVLESYSPTDDHLINVVNIKSDVRQKQPNQLIFNLTTPVALTASGNTEMWVNFDDPVLALDTPTIYQANTNSDATGTDITSSVSIKNIDKFAQSCKITFLNTNSSAGFLTALSLYGRNAKVAYSIDWRSQDDSSVTAYEERLLTIQNDFIQSQDWAQSYSQMILNDFSDIENVQTIVIRAIPELQLGDLISWQGHYWRIFGIKSTLDDSRGFIQELTMIQRTITAYFKIGISAIGGSDKIAP